MDANQLIVQAILKIDARSEKEIKDDMKLLVSSLLEFISDIEPKLFDNTITMDEKTKLVMKKVGGIIKDYAFAFRQSDKDDFAKRFDSLKNILPIIKSYSNE